MSEAISTIIALVSDPREREAIGTTDLGPGMVAHVTDDPAEADRLHLRLHADVVIASHDAPAQAIDALARAHRRDPDCFRVLISRTLEAAPLIRGLNLGVIDALLQAPVAMESLRTQVHQGCEAALLRRHNRSLLAELGSRNHELLELNAHLEATVQHRTAELRHALNELQSANAELKAKQSELVRLETQGHIAQLVRGLAHELNNPLAVVLGYAQRLRRNQADPEQSRRTDVIIQEATRLSNLVERLRTFSQPLEESSSACDLVALLTSTHAQWQQETGLHADLVIPQKLPTPMAAPRALARILSAVLRNAAEAGASQLVVGGEAAFGRVRLSIANDGETPTAEQCRNATRPFFTTRAGSGHQGLGLSVAAGLMHEMHGAIELRPRDAGGAEVIVLLPESAANTTRRVLVVDDEPMLRELICDSLIDDGWQATPAASLSEAEALITARTYDLMVLDRNMGDGDGARWIESHGGSRFAGRVLLITGDEAAAAETGLPAIVKPFAIDDLRQAVGRLIAA